MYVYIYICFYTYTCSYKNPFIAFHKKVCDVPKHPFAHYVLYVTYKLQLLKKIISKL